MTTGLPAGVENLLDKIKDPTYNQFQRDNVCASLERIVRACEAAITQFKRDQSKKR